jgi:hypothetical protein
MLSLPLFELRFDQWLELEDEFAPRERSEVAAAELVGQDTDLGVVTGGLVDSSFTSLAVAELRHVSA